MHDLVEAFNSYTRKEIYDLDVMRKEKKIESIENYLFAIRKNFDNHFYINGKTAENPYFKVDALVWSCIYHEKVPRYSDKVYKMSEYLIRCFKYAKTLSYQDIEGGNIDWNACRIPVNFKDKVMKYNIPLSEYEFKREMNSSYKVKKYHYNYRWPEELTEENLKKTFINMVAHDKLYTGHEKSVRKENLDFDALDREAKKEMIFRLKQKLDEYGELPTDKQEFFVDKNRKQSALMAQFDLWRRNLILPLSEQLDEQYARKKKREETEAAMKGDENNIFDQDAYTPESFADFDKYKKAIMEARRNQEMLKNTLTTEQIEKQDRLKRRMEELDKYAKGESVDMRLIKKKSKFRPPPETELNDEVDDHVEMPKDKKNKYRFW